jgi:ankyrin
MLVVVGTAAAAEDLRLVEAAKTQDLQQVRTLLSGRPAVPAVNLRSEDGSTANQNQTALMWAAAERHAKVAQVLIEASADLQAHTKTGFTALHFAARVGDIESTQTLLNAGVDVNIRSQPDPDARGLGPRGAGAGTGASGAGRAGAARGTGAGAGAGGGFGARSGANFPGSTPLLVATVRGQVPLALFLLEHGADPNVLDAGFTPLFWAAATWENGLANPVYGFVDPVGGIPDREDKLKLVKALLARGANPNLQMTVRPPGYGGTGTGGYNDAAGATPLIVAANSADVEMMRILLAAGADPHLVTKTNSNALLAATGLNRGIGEFIDAEDRAMEAVKFLLDVGVDPKAVTTYNENALFGPSYRGWNKVLELLIEKGAEVNMVNKAGVTPWLAASGFGDRLGGVLFNKAGADILLKHGADPKLGRPCQAQNRCRPE